MDQKWLNQQTGRVCPLKAMKSCRIWFLCQGCGSLVSVSHSAGALSYRSTEDSSLPEILLGLIYNSATGQLSAEVIKGSHFKTTASNKPVSEYNSFFCLFFFFFWTAGAFGNNWVSVLRYFPSQYNSSSLLLIECNFPAESQQLFWQSGWEIPKC